MIVLARLTVVLTLECRIRLAYKRKEFTANSPEANSSRGFAF